jgi:hypothetical protein|tara:strand:+ start:599 stop:1480 length:882 start_codon:yes stop_codon:yes gene_type:complete
MNTFTYTKNLTLAFAASVCLATSGQAATYLLDVESKAQDQSATPTVTSKSDRTVDDFETEIDLAFSHATGRSSSGAQLIANPQTGVIKSFTTIGVTTGSTGRATGRAQSKITIEETFTAAGNGTATFSFAFDGLLRAAGDLGSASVAAYLSFFTRKADFTIERPEIEWKASFGSRDGAFSTFVNNALTTNPLAEFAVDEEISLSIDLVEAQELDVVLRFQTLASSTEARSGSGTSDFFSTGYLGFITTGGLALTASDPDFLSSLAVPIPVPASFGFLLAGIGMLGAARLNRRS